MRKYFFTGVLAVRVLNLMETRGRCFAARHAGLCTLAGEAGEGAFASQNGPLCSNTVTPFSTRSPGMGMAQN